MSAHDDEKRANSAPFRAARFGWPAEDLKPLPCPFCGGTNLAVVTAVWCMTCGASGPGPLPKPDSPKHAWNTRWKP